MYCLRNQVIKNSSASAAPLHSVVKLCSNKFKCISCNRERRELYSYPRTRINLVVHQQRIIRADIFAKHYQLCQIITEKSKGSEARAPGFHLSQRITGKAVTKGTRAGS